MQFSTFASSGCKNTIRTARKENTRPKQKLRPEILLIPSVAGTKTCKDSSQRARLSPQAGWIVPREAAGISFSLTLILHQLLQLRNQIIQRQPCAPSAVARAKNSPETLGKTAPGLCTEQTPVVVCGEDDIPGLSPSGGQPDPQQPTWPSPWVWIWGCGAALAVMLLCASLWERPRCHGDGGVEAELGGVQGP